MLELQSKSILPEIETRIFQVEFPHVDKNKLSLSLGAGLYD